jgi:integrase
MELVKRDYKVDDMLLREVNGELVRDVFIFCVYTGLAFIDVYNLRPEHVSEGSNGNLWIVKPREKTNNICNIPLLSIPKQILEKYKDNPYCMDKGTLLPVPCNQKMNSYLKEIADICGIKKNLTMHVAWHSFASVIALANNVSLPNVAKMLGHSSTRMTQHYAKVLDQTVLRDMQAVEKQLKNL